MSDFEALGNELRDARQRRDLSLTEVERKIHIRAKFLEALECGQVALLPSPVQARGFLRNYARFLGLEADSMVARWDEAVQGGSRRRRRRPPQPAPTARSTQTNPAVTADSPPRRSLRLGTILFGLILLIMLGGLLVMGGQWIQAALAGGTQGAILSPLPSEAATADTTTLTPTAVPTDISGPTPLPNPNIQIVPTATGASGDVALQLEITERTWLRVTVDGKVSYLGAPGPNTRLQYRGNAVNVRASNAAGVHAVVNNRDMGALGARGQIFDQTFTAGGVIASTGTPAPPPSATPNS